MFPTTQERINSIIECCWILTAPLGERRRRQDINDIDTGRQAYSTLIYSAMRTQATVRAIDIMRSFLIG